jgi:hypothetical protein
VTPPDDSIEDSLRQAAGNIARNPFIFPKQTFPSTLLNPAGLNLVVLSSPD